MSKIQFKIMCTLTLLIAIVVTASGFLAERGLRERTTASIKLDLEHQARLFAQLVEGVGIGSANAERLQKITLDGGSSSGARITLIDPTGRVLADSEVPFREMGELANHADRPEVVEAMHQGLGYDMRRSDTLKRTLVYVALRVPAADGKNDYGIVRLAVYLDQLDAAVANLCAHLANGCENLEYFAALGSHFL